jgi:hypothetical protein
MRMNLPGFEGEKKIDATMSPMPDEGAIPDTGAGWPTNGMIHRRGPPVCAHEPLRFRGVETSLASPTAQGRWIGLSGNVAMMFHAPPSVVVRAPSSHW